MRLLGLIAVTFVVSFNAAPAWARPIDTPPRPPEKVERPRQKPRLTAAQAAARQRRLDANRQAEADQFNNIVLVAIAGMFILALAFGVFDGPSGGDY